MLRTLTALTNRAGSNEREWVPDEIALALNVSSGTGWSLQHLAVHACELPGLLEALKSNQLSDRQLRAVIRTVCDPELNLTLEHRQAAIAIMLARYHGQTPHELAKELSKLILQIDLAAAQHRQDHTDTARGPEADARVQDARRVLAAEKIYKHVRRTVATAPPLTESQKWRIAALLWSGVSDTRQEVLCSPLLVSWTAAVEKRQVLA